MPTVPPPLPPLLTIMSELGVTSHDDNGLAYSRKWASQCRRNFRFTASRLNWIAHLPNKHRLKHEMQQATDRAGKQLCHALCLGMLNPPASVQQEIVAALMIVIEQPPATPTHDPAKLMDMGYLRDVRQKINQAVPSAIALHNEPGACMSCMLSGDVLFRDVSPWWNVILFELVVHDWLVKTYPDSFKPGAAKLIERCSTDVEEHQRLSEQAEMWADGCRWLAKWIGVNLPAPIDKKPPAPQGAGGGADYEVNEHSAVGSARLGVQSDDRGCAGPKLMRPSAWFAAATGYGITPETLRKRAHRNELEKRGLAVKMGGKTRGKWLYRVDWITSIYPQYEHQINKALRRDQT